MRFFSIAFFMIILLACNQAEKTVSINDKFDALEKIVGTANWQMVDGRDTSYVYFSRLADALFNVYHYQIDKGDSVKSIMHTITARQDTIIWDWQNTKLFLEDVTDSSISWQETSDEKNMYMLKTIDSLHLSFIFPDMHSSIMKRTLPLATFLVRSHYDYLHNTHTVDSAIVPPRHLLKK